MMNSLVSIITPSYNSEKYIGETIKSVLNQSYKNWELIIVDDCSKDYSREIIVKFSEQYPNIKYVLLEKNSGAAEARNVALKLAKGRFIAFLDSDDLWAPMKLEKQIYFMLKDNLPISFTSYDLIDETGLKMNNTINSIEFLDYKGYLKNTIIGMSTSMIDTSLVDRFEFLNLRTRQDTYLWITLLKRGHKAFGIEEVLAYYRVRNDSISANKIKAVRRVWYLYYNLENLGFVKSTYYFTHYIFNAIKKRF